MVRDYIFGDETVNTSKDKQDKFIELDTIQTEDNVLQSNPSIVDPVKTDNDQERPESETQPDIDNIGSAEVEQTLENPVDNKNISRSIEITAAAFVQVCLS